MKEEICPRCHGTGKLRMCEVPTCPMAGASMGKRGRKPWCQFHSKLENRGKFHPTQKQS